jgi:hypothetical protein
MLISSQAHSNATIKLQDDDPDNVKRMMDYLYGLGYDVNKPQEISSQVVEMENKQPVSKRDEYHGVTYAQMYANNPE